MDVDLPLSTRALTEDVSLQAAVDERRLLCFPFPRRVLRRVVGAASRFYDLNYSPNSRHTYDLIFTAFFMKSLQTAGLASRLERAFIDDNHSRVIIFYLMFKSTAPAPSYNVASFAKDAEHITSLNSLAIFGTQEEAQPAAGGGVGRKRRKMATPPELINAYTLVGRPTVPVDHIRQTPPFNSRVTAWGELLCNSEDLEKALKHTFASRLMDLGHKVVNITFGAPPAEAADVTHAGGHTALDDDAASDTGDDDAADPAPPAAAPGAAAAVATPTFHFADGGSMTLTLAMEDYFQVTHPLTSQFLRDSVRNDRTLLASSPDLWELTAPAVDLPHLAQRYLAHTALYDSFTLYSQGVRAKKDALEANPRGDLSTLSSFFAERPDAREDDKVAAARLVFDVLTRPDGRLPKAMSETMAVFVDVLSKNDQRLPLGSEAPVKVYKNLTYSGNYAIYVMEQFEQVRGDFVPP